MAPRSFMGVPERFVSNGPTPAGDAYVFSDYDAMFRRAGFGESLMQDVPASNERVIMTKK